MNNKNYTIVQNQQELEQFLAHIEKYDYFAFDTETTGLNVRKDRVIGLSICGNPGEAYYLPFETWIAEMDRLEPVWSREQATEVLNLLKQKELIMWNGSYDIRIVKNYFGVDLTDSLLAEGMLMKHTVDEEVPFGLKEVAVLNQKQLGFDAESAANEEQLELKQNVIMNGGSVTKKNYEMFKADLPIMGKYACADADLTLKLALLYHDKIVEEKMESFFYDEEVMPLYRKVTIPMEEHGIPIDLDLIRTIDDELSIDLWKIKRVVVDEFLKIPEVQTWYEEKVIKNFPPKKGGKFAQKIVEHKGWTNIPKNASGKYSITKKNILEFTTPCKESAFLLGNESGRLDQSLILKIAKELHMEKHGIEINLSSKSQMADIVFNHLGVTPLKLNKTGPAFDSDTVDYLGTLDYNWAKQLDVYNKFTKIKGTYIKRFIDNQEDGIYYPYFKQYGTISGRYSSDIQQMPKPLEDETNPHPLVKKYTNILRHFLIAGEGRKFIICDQSSLEPRVFASVANDPNLIKVFTDNEDLYSRVAIQAFKVKDVSAQKSDDNYLKKIYPDLRQRSKAITLSIPYGATYYALHKSLEIDKDEAKKLIRDYLDGFPKLEKWMNDTDDFVKKNGFIKTVMGRTRHLPKVKKLHKQFGNKLGDWRFIKKLKKSHEEKEVNGWVMDWKNGINNARNFQIQGLSGSIMNRAGIAIADEFKKSNIDAHISMQIHDEYVISASEEDVERASEIVKRCMEETVKINVPLIADPNIADSFGEGHD